MSWKVKMSAAALGASLLLSSIQAAAAQQVPVNIDAYYASIQFEFDGMHLAPPEAQNAFIYKGSTYVPLRFIAYSLDKAVEWDGDTYTVTVREPGMSEKTSIEEYKKNQEKKEPKKEKVDASKLVPTSIPVYFETIRYVFDGEVKQSSVELPGLIYQDSLFVPMRFMSESVGKKIEWDPETYSIRASTAKSVPTVETPKPDAGASKPAPSSTGAPAAGGGAAPVAKPSYESLVQEADQKILALEQEARTTMLQYAFSYLMASSNEQKVSIKSEAMGAVSRFDSIFYGITADLKSKLAQNGYDTSIVNTKEEQYVVRKQTEEAALRTTL